MHATIPSFLLAIVSVCPSMGVLQQGSPPRAIVPSPESTPVEIVVSGRTSTLRSIVIEDVGRSIPKTYAGEHVVDVEGYRWYVSRHYALQTDYDEARARHLLTLLELAYPHYVEHFGREIPGIDTTRMAVVYGASRESLDKALKVAGITWDFNGGGITYEGLNIAYQFPSGGLQYHQRYILLHEAMHLYQMCLTGTTHTTPGWYVEGAADAIAHHVWDSASQRLTMSVVDKPTINNWYQSALEQHAREPFRASDILSGRRGGRDLGFLLMSYFAADPSRSSRWRVWRDELFRGDERDAWQAHSDRLIEDLFGADALDRDFEKWVCARRSSFRYVDWGWEQDGDALMSYGWPQSGAYSQTDLLFAPRDKPQYDALVMDYPLHERSPLVDVVKRGVQEPIVGCVVGFAENPDAGVVGLALGVEGRKFVRIVVEQRKRIVVDATDLGGKSASIELSEAFRAATKDTFRIGLTLRIGRAAIEVTARANDGGAMQVAELALPITAAQRERVLARPMAVISRDGKHWITPYVDDMRRAEPDLDVAAPPNRWRFELEHELDALTRAVWTLGNRAPRSLRELQARLVEAANGDGDVRGKVRADFANALTRVRADVKRCGAPSKAIAAALTDLGD